MMVRPSGKGVEQRSGVLPDPKAAGRILGHDKFENMSETAVRLMLRVPYIMVLYYSLQFYETKKIPTLAVNGVACWINPAFWNQLTREQRLTAVAHEIGHKMLLHNTRRGQRDPFIWNMAGDYVINLMLVDSKFVPLTNMTIDGRPWNWLYNTKYQGMTTEQVYDALMKELEDEIEKAKSKCPQGGQDAGQDGDEERDDSGWADDSDSDDEDDSGADSEDDSEAGSGDTGTDGDGDAEGGAVQDAGGGVQRPSTGRGGKGAGVPAGNDDGSDSDDTEDQDLDSTRSAASRAAETRLGPLRDILDFNTDPDGNPFTDGERDPESPQQFEERMRKELREAEAVAKMQGKAPGWMERVIGNAEHQKMPWYEVFEQYLKSMHKADYSWRRWAKREYIKSGMLAPDLYEPAMGGIAVFIDCSGSISGADLSRFSKHFRDIIEQVKPAWVCPIYWDTQAYEPFERFERCEFDEDNTRLKAKGGGGTDFRMFAHHVETELDEMPEVAVCLTDMCATFGRELPIPMIWLSTSSGEEAPYGEVININ